MDDEFVDPWPFRHLVVRTPRLELRPDDDAGLIELAEEAHRGVHPPEEMPFQFAWTDLRGRALGLSVVQFHLRQRAELVPSDWRLNFLVRLDGRVIGSQGLSGEQFAIRREVATGSWIGMRHQGAGIGTEMRSAVLQFAFDRLAARQARSAAHVENHRSLGVSRKLGYRADGSGTVVVRGAAVEHTRLLLSRDRFEQHRPPWRVDVDGLDQCLPLLGVDPTG